MKNIGIKKSASTERLSSGFRINRAADDAAGLAISESMRAQIRGLLQAERNTQDAISLIQTAEGGMNAINELIQRVRELVVQAANDTYTHTYRYDEENPEQPRRVLTQSQRVLIQSEIDNLIDEINHLSARVQFNGKNLLSGAYSSQSGVNYIPPPMPIIESVSALFEPMATRPSGAMGIMPLSTQTPAPPPDVTISDANISAGDPRWTFIGGVLTITNAGNGGIIEIDGANITGLDRIFVQNGTNTDIILNNVNINTINGAALDIQNTIVNLWLVGNNELRAYGSSNVPSSAGVQTTDGTVTINGTGSLTAQGDSGAAGIGGGFSSGGGNIIINGGTVNAVTDGRGAAIGSGGVESQGPRNFDGGNITINGGTVNAISNGIGAAIGGGGSGDGATSGGNIEINGGTVNATANGGGAAIGGGFSGDSRGGAGGSITINDGIVYATTNSYGAAIGGGGTGDGTGGAGGDITIKGGTVNAITNDVGAAIGGGGSRDGTDGGIGGNITINDGVVNAISYGGGAAIGGGISGAGGNITIIGGTVTAEGGDGSAGIGGGSGGAGGNITISGGEMITAEGRGGGAGIGGGFGGAGGNITIIGGKVNATANSYGAAIGGGEMGDGGSITINDGTVNATANFSGAAIGGGGGDGSASGGRGGDITITGGTVNATANSHGAAIGGGGSDDHNGGDGGTVTITGGVVTATTNGSGAAIGGGGSSNGSGGFGGFLNISGNVIITASGGTGGAAVGGGSGSTISGVGSDITVSGGLLEIVSGWIGAGNISTRKGELYILGGNLSISNPAVNINSEIIANHMGDDVYRVEIFLNNNTSSSFAAHTEVEYTVGSMTINAITDSEGRLFMYLPTNMLGAPGSMTIGGLTYTGTLDAISSTHNTQLILTLTTTTDPFEITRISENRIDEDNATVQFVSNRPGVYYYIVRDINDPPPSDNYVLITGQHGFGNAGQNTLNLSGLGSGVKRVYIVKEDEQGNHSNMIDFTIPAYNPPYPPDAPSLPNLLQTDPKSFWFQLGANAKQGLTLHIEAMNAVSLGLLGIANNRVINVMEESGTDITVLLDFIDIALSKTVAERAKLGAMQNRLEYTMRSLSVSAENLQAAESSLRDADMAKEMMELTKSKVLQQAAVSMLAQANQAHQAVSQLLQNIE